jgi:O-antigen ligase
LSSQSALFDLRRWLRPLGALFSFEAVFVLYLASVNYKTDPRLSFIPIDLTLIFLVVGVAVGLMIVYHQEIYLPGLTVVSLFTVFIVWVMLTELWTPSKIYGRTKLLELATLTLWCLIAAALVIANSRERVHRFMLLLLVFGTAASVDGIIQYETRGPLAGTASFRLENYISQGRFYGMGALVAFAAWLQASPFSKRGMALMAAFSICSYALLIGGGRAPILGMLAAMVLPLAVGLRFAKRRLLANKALVASIVLFLAMAVVLLQLAANYSGDLRALQRFGTLLTEGGGQEARLGFWKGSWDLWLEQPLFGSGVGSWPIRYFGFDVGRHPHNLVLEVLVEFGLIGFLLLAAVVVSAVRRTSVRRLREDPLLMCAAMLWINMFLGAMTSSDITGNRNVFAMLGLLVMRPYRPTSSVATEAHAREPGPSDRRRSEPPGGKPSPGRSTV